MAWLSVVYVLSNPSEPDAVWNLLSQLDSALFSTVNYLCWSIFGLVLFPVTDMIKNNLE